MNREQLLHVLRAACEVAGTEVTFLLIGSQAILGTGEYAHPMLTRSMEADLAVMGLPQPQAEAIADKISGAIGEGSMFSANNGYYADGVETTTAHLAPGWEARTSTIQYDAYGRRRQALCLGAGDLAVSKLLAGREKDYEFVAAMLDEGIVERRDVQELLDAVPDDDFSRAARNWLANAPARKPGP